MPELAWDSEFHRRRNGSILGTSLEAGLGQRLRLEQTWGSDLGQSRLETSNSIGTSTEGEGQSQRSLWVQAWVWELRENRPEPVPLHDQAWAWNLQEWAGPRDLCRYRHQYGTSEKVGLSQDLCRTNPKAGFFTGTFRETILSQQSRSWQAWDSKLYGSIANYGSAEQPPGT